MLGGGIVDCSTGGAAAGAADAIGKVEPGFGNDEKARSVGKLCRPLAQIEAGSGTRILDSLVHVNAAHRNSELGA